MRTTGVIPWTALSEPPPRSFDSYEPTPLRAIFAEEPGLYTISFEWEPTRDLFDLEALPPFGFYERVALGIVLDILNPLFWQAAHASEDDDFVQRYFSRDYPSHPLNHITSADAAAAQVIALLRRGEDISYWRDSFRALSNYTDVMRFEFSPDPPQTATNDILAWSIGLTEILTSHPSTFPVQLENALIPVAFYLYYDVMQASQRDDFEPAETALPESAAPDPNLDPRYFTEALNWAINIWWKEFLDALAFRQ